MKARVLIPFIDKTDGTFWPAGVLVDFSQERISEIAGAGAYLEVLEVPKKGRKRKADLNDGK